MLRLYDTALGLVADLRPARPGRFSVYVCGPTVYDVPHIGHGRSVLVYDVLRRYLESTGTAVEHVSNVTDIDDKIIARAAELGRTPDQVAEEFEAEWWKAVDGLGVLRPTHAPHATDYVPGMVDLISTLVSRGAAYDLPDGVYFAVDSVADYGLLAQQSRESLRAGARVDAVEGKRAPEDFALWKRAKPGEPSWNSPWGPGRPGWHTECVVMSLDLLGEGFDLHTGGLDLKFPHHENERAQALALGRDFCRHWMHHAFVEVAGEKMSKSLGNFTSLTDLLAREDGRAYRLLVLQAHYRSPVEVTQATIARAVSSLERLDLFRDRFPEAFAAPAGTGGEGPAGEGPAGEGTGGAGSGGEVPGREVMARFRAFMDDDLDTPGAVATLFEAVRRANAAADEGRHEDAGDLARAVAYGCRAVGLGAPADRGGVPPEVVDLVARLDAARAGRDFATADAIRAELTTAGWVVENAPGGTRVRRR